MTTKEEKTELRRIINGGAYDEQFWRSRWHAARLPSEEDELRKAIRECPVETVQHRRQARKLASKLNKLAGKKRALMTCGYAQNWNEEQKRLDNLQHAAIFIHRANTDFHFFA